MGAEVRMLIEVKKLYEIGLKKLYEIDRKKNAVEKKMLSSRYSPKRDAAEYMHMKFGDRINWDISDYLCKGSRGRRHS